MITQTEAVRQAGTKIARVQRASWQQALADVIRDYDELLEVLQLDPRQAPSRIENPDPFPLRVPREFVARMQPGDWRDPLLLQVLPQGRELDHQPGFGRDPLGEAERNPVPGLIHKYRGRVLLVVSGGCAIHCRYCFRRHFPYQDNTPGQRNWSRVIDYIQRDPSIHEVIFSGGDPLAASDRLLADLVAQLAEIPHLRTLRIHSRLPVVIPQRITPQCLEWMTGSRLKPVMVIHSNHANEIDAGVSTALELLRRAGVTTLNQTVLLAGINDTVDNLQTLSERLFEAGCLPYYLHLLDRVAGAGHFEVDEDTAKTLVTALIQRVPGYLAPRLVREIPGAPSKCPVNLD